jgi:CBS domain-containing protein
MDIELIEIRDFLAAHHPFDGLPQAVLAQLPGALTVRYLRRGAVFPPSGDEESLCVLRSGAVELRDGGGELVEKLAEGACYAAFPHTAGAARSLTGTAVEDTLLYLLPKSRLESLRMENPPFDRLFVASVAERMSRALALVSRAGAGATLINVEVGDLVAKAPVCVTPETSIRDAAIRMREQRVSSLMIVDGQRLAGVLTDRDLRNRCVAEGLEVTRPVREVMSAEVHTVARQAPAFDALMEMARLNVHHLPVLDRGRLVGVISTSDLVRHESANAVYLVGEARKALTRDALVEVSRKLPDLQIRLAASDATARHVGEAVSAVTDALTIRSIELAEARLGPPPMPYAWVAGGSQARREQTAHSDQDNALILSRAPSQAEDAWFAALAQSVNEALDACGLVYCPGDVMAKNRKWRQPLEVWRTYFDGWIERPEPMALMLSSVFFDLRVVHGDRALLESLQQHTLPKTSANTIFLAHMSGNALTHRPPLGFFRNLVLVSGGEHDKTFDIKHRGLVPVVDLARVYALAEGVADVNTLDRLQAVAGSASISEDAARSLADGYEFIATLRVRHQAAQLRRGEAPDNFLSPQQLSTLERTHLKEAFNLIASLQRALRNRFPLARGN